VLHAAGQAGRKHGFVQVASPRLDAQRELKAIWRNRNARC